MSVKCVLAEQEQDDFSIELKITKYPEMNSDNNLIYSHIITVQNQWDKISYHNWDYSGLEITASYYDGKIKIGEEVISNADTIKQIILDNNKMESFYPQKVKEQYFNFVWTKNGKSASIQIPIHLYEIRLENDYFETIGKVYNSLTFDNLKEIFPTDDTNTKNLMSIYHWDKMHCDDETGELYPYYEVSLNSSDILKPVDISEGDGLTFCYGNLEENLNYTNLFYSSIIAYSFTVPCLNFIIVGGNANPYLPSSPLCLSFMLVDLDLSNKKWYEKTLLDTRPYSATFLDDNDLPEQAVPKTYNGKEQTPLTSDFSNPNNIKNSATITIPKSYTNAGLYSDITITPNKKCVWKSKAEAGNPLSECIKPINLKWTIDKLTPTFSLANGGDLKFTDNNWNETIGHTININYTTNMPDDDYKLVTTSIFDNVSVSMSKTNKAITFTRPADKGKYYCNAGEVVEGASYCTDSPLEIEITNTDNINSTGFYPIVTLYSTCTYDFDNDSWYSMKSFMKTVKASQMNNYFTVGKTKTAIHNGQSVNYILVGINQDKSRNDSDNYGINSLAFVMASALTSYKTGWRSSSSTAKGIIGYNNSCDLFMELIGYSDGNNFNVPFSTIYKKWPTYDLDTTAYGSEIVKNGVFILSNYELGDTNGGADYVTWYDDKSAKATSSPYSYFSSSAARAMGNNYLTRTISNASCNAVNSSGNFIVGSLNNTNICYLPSFVIRGIGE